MKKLVFILILSCTFVVRVICQDSSLQMQTVQTDSVVDNSSNEKHNKPVRLFEMTKDGDHILIQSGNNEVKIFETATGKLEYRLKDETTMRTLGAAAFSPDGKYVATISFPENVKIWDMTSGKLVNDLKIQTNGKITGIEFSPSGKYIYAIATPSSFVQSFQLELEKKVAGFTTVWETSTGKLIQTHKKFLYQFNVDETRIIYISSEMYHFSVDVCVAVSGATLFSSGSSRAPECSGDGKYVLCYPGNKSQLYELASGKMMELDPKYCWFVGDGKYISYRENKKNPDEYSYILTANQKPVTDPLCSIYSPYLINKEYMAKELYGKNKGIEIWKIDSCKLVQTIKDESSLRYSPNGENILTIAPSGKSANLRDISSGELLYSLEIKVKNENFFTERPHFSPGGKFIIASYYKPFSKDDSGTSIWESKTGKFLYFIPANGTFGMLHQFSRDDKYFILEAGKEVKVLDAATGKLLYELQ